MLDRSGNGTRIGRYEILRRLAVGGMAEVLLARVRGPAGFEKRVVLKCVLPQFVNDPEFLTMFLDEARLVASLNHPNIAEVHDVGSDGETTYIAMEYVEGADVRTVLKTLRARNEKMPLEHVLTIASAVCAGLHAAHDKRTAEGQPLGIVHRDVSPSNVMVSFEGGVKLVDFGIAKWDARNVRTRSGLLKGKSAYMSPEQCMGLELDRRSDLFAVGILLHEMVTGQPLFKAENDYAAMCKVVRDEVPPPSAMRTIPPALETTILRALARRPEDRFQTADELALALEQIALRERISTSPTNLARWMQALMATAEANPTPSPHRAAAPVSPNPTPLPGMPPPLHGAGSAPRPSTMAVTVESLPLKGTPPDGSPRANPSALPTMIEQGLPGVGLMPRSQRGTELGIAPVRAAQTPTPLVGAPGVALSALDVPPTYAPPAFVPPPTPVSPTMAERIMQERMATVVEAPLVAVTETPTDLRLKRLNLATGTGNSKLSALDVRPPRRVGSTLGRLLLASAFATSLVLAWIHYGDDARRLWRAQAGASEAEDVKAAAAEPKMPAALQPSDVAPPEPTTAARADSAADADATTRTANTADAAPTPEKTVKKVKARRDREERRDRKKRARKASAVKGPGAGLSLDDAPEPDDGGPGGSIDL